MNTLDVVDLVFSLTGSEIPQDHGYSLYAAIARMVPEVHATLDVGIFPIRGASIGRSRLSLTDTSQLRLRLPAAKIPALLPLSGMSIEVAGFSLGVGVPRVVSLVPAARLVSSMVTIKLAQPKSGDDFVAPEAFVAAARKQLQAHRIQGEPQVLSVPSGSRSGEARRRVIRIKGHTHVGYGMVIEGLTAEESILVQERGLGGRRLMGCGLFLPAKDRTTGR